MLRDRPPLPRDVPRPDGYQATEHVRFIRDVMGRSAPFAAVSGRQYGQRLLPSPGAGAILTLALSLGACLPSFDAAALSPGGSAGDGGPLDLLPGVWLLLYGADTVAGGLSPLPLVPRIGVAFVAAGALARFLPLFHANTLLAVGFGRLHLLAGVIVRKRYGG